MERGCSMGDEKPTETGNEHEWELGHWGLWGGEPVRFIVSDPKTGGGFYLRANGSITQLVDTKYAPLCTGFNWQAVEPPEGYRPLLRHETVVESDICLDKHRPGWRPASGKSIGCAAGFRMDSYGVACFARKIEPTYRPFTNGAEYKPYRDLWICWKKADKVVMRVDSYNDDGIWEDQNNFCSFAQAFCKLVFEGGLPFGVEVNSGKKK